MKPPCEPFEEELRRLQPKAPRPELMLRIEAALDNKPAENTVSPWQYAFSSWISWAAAAVVAGGVALFWAFNPATPEKSPPAVASARETLKPDPSLRLVNQTQYLYDAQDEGIIYLDQSVPYRKVRCQFVDAVRWQNSDNNFTVELSTPAEEVVLLPVNTY